MPTIINMLNLEKHSGISGIPTQLLVLHSGETPLRGGFAQSVTKWANVPLSLGGPEASWHWFVDPLCIVSMVPPQYAAWHASEANPMSEGFEQSGYARFTRAEWLTPDGLKQIDILGWLMAERAKANGIPMVWLTTAQVTAITSGRDRVTKGFCTHRQIDPETRYDPGDGYPFDVLTAKVKHYLNPTKEVDVITLIQLKDYLLKFGWAYKGAGETEDAYQKLRDIPKDVWAETVSRGGGKISVLQELADAKTLGLENKAALAELSEKVDALLKHAGIDPTTI